MYYYLVTDERVGPPVLVFTLKNPQSDGYDGDVDEGITLDYDMDAVHIWSEGEESFPRTQLAEIRQTLNIIKFSSMTVSVRPKVSRQISANYSVNVTWTDYLKLHRADELPESVWFDELDR